MNATAAPLAGVTLISDLHGHIDLELTRLGFGVVTGSDSATYGQWTSRDAGVVRFVAYVDDERAEMLVLDKPRGLVTYRVEFSGSTPAAVILAAVSAAVTAA